MDLLVINALRYSFADKEDANRKVEGMNLHVIPMGSTPQNEADRRGLDIIKMDCKDRSAWDGLKELPGIYEASTMLATSKGKSTLKVTSLKFVKAVQLA